MMGDRGSAKGEQLSTAWHLTLALTRLYKKNHIRCIIYDVVLLEKFNQLGNASVHADCRELDLIERGKVNVGHRRARFRHKPVHQF